MYLGLRIGETLALNINDIDIEKQIINVWAGSLCGLSAGLKIQRMKVRHLPGPPI